MILLTNDARSSARNLIARYAKRMLILTLFAVLKKSVIAATSVPRWQVGSSAGARDPTFRALTSSRRSSRCSSRRNTGRSTR